MEWFVIIGLLAVGVYFVLRLGAKPIRYRHQTLNDIRRFTEGLFAQGGDGALLFVHHEGSDRFVQFAKYLTPKRAVHFAFPDVPWSRDLYSAVRAALSDAGFACVDRSGSDGTRFACIDDIPSGQRAAEIAVVAFAAMGLGTDARFTIHQEGSVSWREWKSHAADWERFARNQDG
jgi:hypothetical protein